MEQQTSLMWDKCLSIIRDNITPEQYSASFAFVKLHSFVDGKMVLDVPSEFVKKYIEDNFLPLMASTFRRVFNDRVKSLFYNVTVASQQQGGAVIEKTDITPRVVNGEPRQDARKSPDDLTAPHVQDLDSQLIPHYRFDNYIEGESNRLARSVGESIANNPAHTFNPYFVYGPSGCGKTHLINAIGLRIKELHPDMRVIYLSAHLFTVQYTDAVRQNKVNDFIRFYQTIDTLIIDDIQELSGKTQTQNTFFHIFNHLFMNGRRIILASDRSPVELKDMNDRLLSRFSCGLIAELEKPNEELCVDILKSKIRRDALSIPDDVITYIAQTANGSVRDLEGVINSLLAYSVVYSCPINMRLVERIIQRAIKTDNSPLTVDDILEKVCNHFGVTQSAIYSKSRKRDYVVPRQLTMFFTAKYTKMPASRIGKLIGGRDHSTVIHSCSQIETRIKVDKAFEDEVISIENSFKLKK